MAQRGGKGKITSSSLSTAALGGFGIDSSSLGFGSAESVSLEGLSPENALIFKKIVKKDATTKIKGLEELRVFIESNGTSDHENMPAVLAKWVAEFPRLVEDNAPKVRFLALKLMGLIGKTFKSRLQPKLKELIPAWMCGVYDPRKEIATMAWEGLRGTIPETKHAATINFVRLGIIDYLDTHLSTLMESSGAMLTSQPSNEENSESFSRICETNLSLLMHLVETLSSDDFTKVSSKVSDLMDNFIWRMQKATDPKIRGQFYSLLASLLRHTAFVQPRLESISKIVIPSLSDADPQTSAKAWAAVIALFKTFPLFTLPWFNAKKLLLPPLTQAIKASTATEATYVALLPLLSTLPIAELSDDFFNSFFGDLWRGLKNAAHVNLVVTTYFDCLVYTVPRVPAAQQANLIEKHFNPIFLGFFNYPKALSDNITYSIALFVSRLEAKNDPSATRIWDVLTEQAQKHLVLLSDGVAPTLDKEASPLFATKLSQLLLQLQAAKLETKQSMEASAGAAKFFSLLLAPTLDQLAKLDFSHQIQLISETGSVWRSIASLTTAQERKKSEAAEFLEKTPSAPQYVVDLLRNPLQISLHMSLDNSDWQVLLKGLVQQQDWKSIQKFVSPDKPALYWRCADLDLFALTQCADDALHREDNILAFLIAGDGDSYLHDQTLTQLQPLLAHCASSISSTWTTTYLDNVSASMFALHKALMHAGVDASALLEKVVEWALPVVLSDSTPSSQSQTLSTKASKHIIEVASGASGASMGVSQIVVRIQENLSALKKRETTSVPSPLASFVAHLISALSSSGHLALALSLLAQVLPSSDDWSSVHALELQQHRTDAFHLDPLASAPAFFPPPTHLEITVPGALLIVDYSSQLIAGVQSLQQLASYQTEEPDATSWPAEILPSLVSNLIISEAILSMPASAQASTIVSTAEVKNCVSTLSAALDLHVLPIVLSHLPNGEIALISHFVQSMEKSHSQRTWLTATQIDRVLQYILQSESLPNKADIITSIWKNVLSKSPPTLSFIAGLKNQSSCVSLLSSTDFTKNAINQALSDLYQLKPATDGSLPSLYAHAGHSLLVASALLPLAPSTSVDSRKIMEVFAFSTKHGFSIAQSYSLSVVEQELLVGLCQFLARVILGVKDISSYLTEANYAIIFDITEKLVNMRLPETHDQVSLVSNNAMALMEALSSYIFELQSWTADWAHFVSKNLGLQAPHWTALGRNQFDAWSKSYLQRWARCMRFVPSSIVTSLDSSSLGDLYQLLQVAFDVQVQSTTFLMLLALIKDHNAHTYTKAIEASSSHYIDSDETIHDDVLDSKVLPDQLLQVVLDVEHGYEDPLLPSELSSQEDPIDSHIYDVSISTCASTLLAWRLILEFLNSKDEKEKNDVITWIRQSQLLQLLVPLLCNLADIEHPAKISESSLDKHLLKNAFWQTELRSDQTNATRSHILLQEMAQYVLRDLFEFVPVLIRSWWQQADGQMRIKFENFSSKYVSPLLINKELSKVSSWKPLNAMLDEFGVKSTSAGEVIATYKKDEVELAITLKLHSAHPLQPVTVSMSHKAIAEPLWRKWLLSMRSMLLTRDGSVLDAVLLWRNYLDRHFEGVECCPICYAIFHISNYSLPDLPCKTCRNKFHKACLYKWFNTAHHNECPLCKTPFN